MRKRGGEGMSDSSSEDLGKGLLDDLDFNPLKRHCEKKRRDQENVYLDELSQLISANFPELDDLQETEPEGTKADIKSLGGFPQGDKGSILRETVQKLRKIRDESSELVPLGDVSSSEALLPREILGSLVLEALDGFMFIVNSDGRVDFVTENVSEFLGGEASSFTDQSIYNLIHVGDHARFLVNLSPETWSSWQRLNTATACQPGEVKHLDRSKVFNVRFLINGHLEAKEEVSNYERVALPDDHYENMQVSAIAMLNTGSSTPARSTDSSKHNSGLFCIARKLNDNDFTSFTPVDQFTTQIDYESNVIDTVDTSGLPDQYVEVIGRFCIGKRLINLVHPDDAPLLLNHMKTLMREGQHISRVYRMNLPPPHYTVHVRTKSKVFKANPATDFKGCIMSTHTIVREIELKLEDRADLRPELANQSSNAQNQALPRSSSSSSSSQQAPVSQSNTANSNNRSNNSEMESRALQALLSSLVTQSSSTSTSTTASLSSHNRPSTSSSTSNSSSSRSGGIAPATCATPTFITSGSSTPMSRVTIANAGISAQSQMAARGLQGVGGAGTSSGQLTWPAGQPGKAGSPVVSTSLTPGSGQLMARGVGTPPQSGVTRVQEVHPNQNLMVPSINSLTFLDEPTSAPGQLQRSLSTDMQQQSSSQFSSISPSRAGLTSPPGQNLNATASNVAGRRLASPASSIGSVPSPMAGPAIGGPLTPTFSTQSGETPTSGAGESQIKSVILSNLLSPGAGVSSGVDNRSSYRGGGFNQPGQSQMVIVQSRNQQMKQNSQATTSVGTVRPMQASPTGARLPFSPGQPAPAKSPLLSMSVRSPGGQATSTTGTGGLGSPGSVSVSATSPGPSTGNQLLKGLLTGSGSARSSMGLGSRSPHHGATPFTAATTSSTSPANSGDSNLSLIQLLNGKGGASQAQTTSKPMVSEPSELLRRLRQPRLDSNPSPSNSSTITREKLNSELSRLLESKPVPSIASGLSAGYKRPYPLQPSREEDNSGPTPPKMSVSSPSLELLLRKEARKLPTPPPLPRKWTEIPGEKLNCREEIMSRIKEHQKQNPSTATSGSVGGAGSSSSMMTVSNGPVTTSLSVIRSSGPLPLTGGQSPWEPAAGKPEAAAKGLVQQSHVPSSTATGNLHPVGAGTAPSTPTPSDFHSIGIDGDDWPEETLDILNSSSLRELLDSVVTSDLTQYDPQPSDDQAQIDAIEEQLKLVESSIGRQSQEPPTPPPPQQGLATSVGGETSIGTNRRLPVHPQKPLSGSSTNFEDLLKGVPPNVTMRPGSTEPLPTGLGVIGKSETSRHLSGDVIGGKPGPSGGNNNNNGLYSGPNSRSVRHVSGDSYMSGNGSFSGALGGSGHVRHASGGDTRSIVNQVPVYLHQVSGPSAQSHSVANQIGARQQAQSIINSPSGGAKPGGGGPGILRRMSDSGMGTPGLPLSPAVPNAGGAPNLLSPGGYISLKATPVSSNNNPANNSPVPQSPTAQPPTTVTMLVGGNFSGGNNNQLPPATSTMLVTRNFGGNNVSSSPLLVSGSFGGNNSPANSTMLVSGNLVGNVSVGDGTGRIQSSPQASFSSPSNSLNDGSGGGQILVTGGPPGTQFSGSSGYYEAAASAAAVVTSLVSQQGGGGNNLQMQNNRMTGYTANVVSGPSGRPLSQEDLEDLGLSVELSDSEFPDALLSSNQPRMTVANQQFTQQQTTIRSSPQMGGRGSQPTHIAVRGGQVTQIAARGGQVTQIAGRGQITQLTGRGGGGQLTAQRIARGGGGQVHQIIGRRDQVQAIVGHGNQGQAPAGAVAGRLGQVQQGIQVQQVTGLGGQGQQQQQLSGGQVQQMSTGQVQQVIGGQVQRISGAQVQQIVSQSGQLQHIVNQGGQVVQQVVSRGGQVQQQVVGQGGIGQQVQHIVSQVGQVQQVVSSRGGQIQTVAMQQGGQPAGVVGRGMIFSSRVANVGEVGGVTGTVQPHNANANQNTRVMVPISQVSGVPNPVTSGHTYFNRPG